MNKLSAGSGGQNSGTTEILVLANPTKDVLQLQLNKVYVKMNVQNINSAGQIVKQLTFSSPNQNITIPVQNRAAGKYGYSYKAATKSRCCNL